MRARRTSKFLALVIAALGLAGARESAAQPWPSRPVTIVMPFSAGATGDLVARSFAEYLAKEFGQPFVVDNRTGAGGNVGGASVARAAPDGYTLLLATTGPAANNKLMYKKPLIRKNDTACALSMLLADRARMLMSGAENRSLPSSFLAGTSCIVVLPVKPGRDDQHGFLERRERRGLVRCWCS